MLNLMTLPRGTHDGLHVRPRWPARRVLLDVPAFKKLQTIQARLPDEIGLILTRGFEPAATHLGFARKQFRALGIGLFRLMYPGRRSEITDIFGSNGHDVDGSHVDVSFQWNGRRVRLLPLGVFTPPSMQRRRTRQFASPLAKVCAALIQEGFHIHNNPTESLQIHCDLIS
ncbi:hypothetical protein [Dyella subtropica]|uniref:hypothetical protein n=1 Tax=Dyella subtropica TaxID=2992127 RepID=UPI00225AEE05|nr:hypothetical protein [Dyella subtropica]